MPIALVVVQLDAGASSASLLPAVLHDCSTGEPTTAKQIQEGETTLGYPDPPGQQPDTPGHPAASLQPVAPDHRVRVTTQRQGLHSPGLN